MYLIWLAGASCDGCTTAALDAAEPGIEDLLLGHVPDVPLLQLRHPVVAIEGGDDRIWYRHLEITISHGYHAVNCSGALPMLNRLVLEEIEIARSYLASDDEDRTPELAKIGKQPRRPPGGAEPQSRRAGNSPGPATFDATALTLSVAAMPEHATMIRAFRQPAGGTAQLAGTSTTTHSRRAGIAAGPLTRGVTYEFWIVGHNSQGDGPESNHVPHAVPASP